MTALYKYFLALPAVLLICLAAYAQQGGDEVEEDLRRAGIFHRNYQFGKAVEYYSEALGKTADTTLRLEIMERIVECQNGQSMMQYIVRPDEITSGIFRINEFFLYIDEFSDNSWIPVPNPFIKTPGHRMNRFYTSMYLPEGSNRVIFSAPDESGAWNLYTSSLKDSVVWTAPVLLSENILSSGNEIFPILSKDGKTLYFASDGLPGMGGYDLFCSTWDEENEDWSTPENLGFPYSSTGDDILFLNNEAGSCSIIVSNRETEGDSVKIYVTDFIATPVKTPLGKDESPLLISSFTHRPETEEKTADTAGSRQPDSYSLLIHQLRRLQGEQKEKLDKIEESRSIYAKASAGDREFLAGIIRDIEQESMNIKKQIDELSAQVRKMEIQFLSDGIIPIYEEEQQESTELPATVTDNRSMYVFRKHTSGKIPYIIVEVPEPEFDYSFKILGRDKGQFAEDNTLPDGIVYQIQFMVLSSRATVRDIKGMSPVFVTRMPSGKYLHSVGLFGSYQEALSNLNRVRKNGFPEAFIIAFDNGRSISVKTARNMEGKKQTQTERISSGELAWQVILSGYEHTLPQSVLATIQQLSGKDITRTVQDDGETVFAIGPFNGRQEAEDLLNGLDKEGINASIKSIKL